MTRGEAIVAMVSDGELIEDINGNIWKFNKEYGCFWCGDSIKSPSHGMPFKGQKIHKPVKKVKKYLWDVSYKGTQQDSIFRTLYFYVPGDKGLEVFNIHRRVDESMIEVEVSDER